MRTFTDVEIRILDEAEVLFAEKGFDATSIRDITAAAGVNIAAVHYHFRDKEGLYIETVKRAHACSMAGDHLPPAHSTIQSPREQLDWFIRDLVRRMQAPTKPSAMKLMMREMAMPGKAAHVVVEEFIRPMAMRLLEHLRSLLPQLDEQHLLMVGFSVIGQALYYRQNRPVSELIFGKDSMSSLHADMVADHVVQVTFAMIDHVYGGQ